MRARNRQFLIVVERKTETGRDAYNKPILTWSEHCKAWSAIYWGSGSEQRQAAQEQAAQSASFEVLANSKTRVVTVLDRIVFGGGYWNITAIQPLGNNEGVRFTAIRAVP